MIFLSHEKKGRNKMLLQNARKSRLLNQWTIGQYLGVSQAKVSMIERGQVCLSESEKKRIAEILQMSVDSIDWPAPCDLVEQTGCQQAECQAVNVR
jgi:DNA-binding XRE family transcriptional regulator